MTTDILSAFTDDDLNVLMDALEAWEVKDTTVSLMVDMVDTMMTGEGAVMPPDLIAKRRALKLVRETDAKYRKDRSVLLRAKLIQVRNSRQAERLANEALLQ